MISEEEKKRKKEERKARKDKEKSDQVLQDLKAEVKALKAAHIKL